MYKNRNTQTKKHKCMKKNRGKSDVTDKQRIQTKITNRR